MSNILTASCSLTILVCVPFLSVSMFLFCSSTCQPGHAKRQQTSPTDALSRKGLVVLVKQRRSLLEMLQHRDNGRWLATTEALGLRQRADAAAAGEQQMKLAARRTRRRDRGRKRRMDSMDSK